MSAGAIERRVASGVLVPVHRGVYAVAFRSLDRTGIWHAAVLAGGSGAAISHADAGASWAWCG